MNITAATIKKLYKDAIIKVFGTGSKVLDRQLIKAVKTDIHLGRHSPGQWSPRSVLEIYCENGIPNATDVNDFTREALEFGFDPSSAYSYNSDSWDKVDGIVNLYLAAVGHPTSYFHEPYNAAVINIWPS